MNLFQFSANLWVYFENVIVVVDCFILVDYLVWFGLSNAVVDLRFLFCVWISVHINYWAIKVIDRWLVSLDEYSEITL